jgi:serine/threonine protein kinase
MMPDLVGKQFGEYRLVRFLGNGTFGEVYEGEQIYLKTHVAIKVLHAQLDQAEFQRFVEEARTIAALEHSHIVRVLSFSIFQQHTPYLVMQLAQSSLKDRFALGQPQTVETILPYVRQATEGLQYAHDQRIMHLDIKPANLLLTTQNQVLLADFGLAMVLQTQRTHRTLHGFAGTPAYAAPEQFQNKPSLASDQYALGVMVYQWLTGMLPFEGDWWAIGHQKVTQDPPLLLTHTPTISSAVEDVILRSLAKDPKARFACVKEFAEALGKASYSQQVSLPTPKPTRPMPSPLPPTIPVPPPRLTPTIPVPTPQPPARRPLLRNIGVLLSILIDALEGLAQKFGYLGNRGMLLVILLLVIGLPGYFAFRNEIPALQQAINSSSSGNASDLTRQPPITSVLIYKTVRFAGVDITITTAQQSKAFLDDTNAGTVGVVRVNLKEVNTSTSNARYNYFDEAHLILPDKTSVAPVSEQQFSGPDAGVIRINWLDFPVSESVQISQLTLQLGRDTKTQKIIPLTGKKV